MRAKTRLLLNSLIATGQMDAPKTRTGVFLCNFGGTAIRPGDACRKGGTYARTRSGNLVRVGEA